MCDVIFIKAPKRFSDNFGDSFREILRIVRNLNEHPSSNEINVDLKENKFSGPFYLGALSALLTKLSYLKKEIHIDYSSSYLSTIYFPSGIPLNLEKIELTTKSLQRFNDKTYIPIIHFSSDTTDLEEKIRTEIISTINNILKTQLKLPTNILQAFYYFIDELTQNIIHHSQSTTVRLNKLFYKNKTFAPSLLSFSFFS